MERKFRLEKPNCFLRAPHTKPASSQILTLAREQKAEFAPTASAHASLWARKSGGQAASEDGGHCPASHSLACQSLCTRVGLVPG